MIVVIVSHFARTVNENRRCTRFRQGKQHDKADNIPGPLSPGNIPVWSGPRKAKMEFC
jgi:hypothetical protein